MPTLEMRQLVYFNQFIGQALLKVATGTFSLSKFHTLLNELEKFVGDAHPESRPTLKNPLLRNFLTPDGFIDEERLFEQIKSRLLVRTQNLLAAFLNNYDCHKLSIFLRDPESAWNQQPMRNFGPKYRSDLKTILAEYGLRPGMTELELQDLFDSRWK